jgi:hypothetical protein
MKVRRADERRMDSDYAVLADAWAWADAYGRERGWRTRVLLTPTARRGVWRLRVEVDTAAEGGPVRSPYAYECEYPASIARALAATVFAAYVQVSRLVDAGLAQDALPL